MSSFTNKPESRKDFAQKKKRSLGEIEKGIQENENKFSRILLSLLNEQIKILIRDHGPLAALKVVYDPTSKELTIQATAQDGYTNQMRTNL